MSRTNHRCYQPAVRITLPLTCGERAQPLNPPQASSAPGTSLDLVDSPFSTLLRVRSQRETDSVMLSASDDGCSTGDNGAAAVGAPRPCESAPRESGRP